MSDKPTLPKPIPERNATPADLLAWVTKATCRTHNPLVAVRRWGHGLDARLVLAMRNGDELRVRTRDLLSATGLRNVLVAYDGTVLPAYGGGAELIVARIVWAADLSIADDELDTLVLDVDRFLTRSLIPDSGVAQVERRDYAEDGYAVIADFLRSNRGRSGDPREHPPPLLIFDASDSSLWVPRGALMTFLRSVRPKAADSDVRALLEETGWCWINLQRRQPRGDNRPIARLWLVPIPWPASSLDLAGMLVVSS
jgi:hypothetical protein